MSTKPADSSRHPRRRRRAVLLAAPALAVLTTVGTVAASVPAQAATAPAVVPFDGYGYVTQGNLRTDPNLSAGIEVTIYNQWVDIKCWLDAGDNGFGSTRWFKAQYYSNVGYLSTGVVSHQPVVGHC